MDLIQGLTLSVSVISAVGTVWAARASAQAAKGSEQASRAAERQIEIAESSRKIQILPHVVMHSLKQDVTWHSTWLVIENVGPGAAINVEISILEGEDYKIHDTMALKDYSPIKHGIRILPSGSLLDTILGSNIETSTKPNDFLTRTFRFELFYQDIEGKPYGPHRFEIQKFPLYGRVSTQSHNQKLEKALDDISSAVKKISDKS